jgi:hypothetical protein
MMVGVVEKTELGEGKAEVQEKETVAVVVAAVRTGVYGEEEGRTPVVEVVERAQVRVGRNGWAQGGGVVGEVEEERGGLEGRVVVKRRVREVMVSAQAQGGVVETWLVVVGREGKGREEEEGGSEDGMAHEVVTAWVLEAGVVVRGWCPPAHLQTDIISTTVLVTRLQQLYKQ